MSYFKMLFIAILGLGLSAPEARANNTQGDVDGACQAPQATAPMTCAQLSEASNIAQQVAHPIITRVRRMAHNAHRKLADDGTMLRTHFMRMGPEQQVARLLALEAELIELDSQVCDLRNTRPVDRNEADCLQVKAALNYYNTHIKPVVDHAHIVARLANSLDPSSNTLHNTLASALPNLTATLSCENSDVSSDAANNETLLSPVCGQGRLILLQMAAPADRNRLWRGLNYRHTTASGARIANNGYTLGGGRRGQREVGHTTDCSDFACRAITGSSRPGCPTTEGYIAIGAYLETGRNQAAVNETFRWHSCFERVIPTPSNPPVPGDIIVYPGHMVFVDRFDASTGMVNTIEANGTFNGIRQGVRRLEAYEPPAFCSNTTPDQQDAIPREGSHILRLRTNPPPTCPRTVRDQIHIMNRAP